MFFKSLVLILLIGTVLAKNLKHRNRKESTPKASTADLKAMIDTLNGAVSQLQSTMDNVGGQNDAQVQRALTDTNSVFMNLIKTLEEGAVKYEDLNYFFEVPLELLKNGVQQLQDMTGSSTKKVVRALNTVIEPLIPTSKLISRGLGMKN
jgi:N-methylhydantoinase B/oxoprolinase/acetone carboxylase alpha subunit